MPVTRKKTRVNQTASARAARGDKAVSRWTPEEVDYFQQQAARHVSSEQAWLRLTDAGEEDDRWSVVEESILARERQQAGAERRWKFFAK